MMLVNDPVELPTTGVLMVDAAQAAGADAEPKTAATRVAM